MIIDVMTVGETGRVGESDEAQLIWATVQGRVLYSSNIGDFCRLHNDFIILSRKEDHTRGLFLSLNNVIHLG